MVEESAVAITQKDVIHISKLARIELTQAEETKFEKELSAVLDFVAKLNEVNTENVVPLTGGTELVNSMRADETLETSLSHKELERAAKLITSTPEHKDGFIKVRAVFE